MHVATSRLLMCRGYDLLVRKIEMDQQSLPGSSCGRRLGPDDPSRCHEFRQQLENLSTAARDDALDAAVNELLALD